MVEEFNCDLLVVNVVLAGLDLVVERLHSFPVCVVSGVCLKVQIFLILVFEGLVFLLEQ